jgi:acyl phosphate:glycerol-3-phosphate acyltransferase
MPFTLTLILAYLIGSCPSAILTCHMLGLPDPRQQGSNNPGATNVLRIGGKKAGAITLVADMAKGLIPVIIAHTLALPAWQIGLVGLASCLGHVFPIFAHFKGGKGVATYFGALWGISPINGIITTGIWLIITGSTRYVSLASMVAAVSAAITSIWIGHGTAGLALMAGIIVWRHHDNIRRLKQGTESKTSLFSSK